MAIFVQQVSRFSDKSADLMEMIERPGRKRRMETLDDFLYAYPSAKSNKSLERSRKATEDYILHDVKFIPCI